MTAEWKPVDWDPKDVNGDNGEKSPIRTVRYVRLRSILMGFMGKSSKYWLIHRGTYFDSVWGKVVPILVHGGNMKQIVKSIGDREIAWIMLAVAAVAIWSTWGIIS